MNALLRDFREWGTIYSHSRPKGYGSYIHLHVHTYMYVYMHVHVGSLHQPLPAYRKHNHHIQSCPPLANMPMAVCLRGKTFTQHKSCTPSPHCPCIHHLMLKSLSFSCNRQLQGVPIGHYPNTQEAGTLRTAS